MEATRNIKIVRRRGEMSKQGVHIAVKELSHRYASRGPITFDQVNLESLPGEVLAIIGRSGCGKSTLLHIMAGLLAPTAGEIRIDDVPVKDPSPRWVMMFQAPHLFPWMHVRQNVGIGLKFAHWPESKIQERVEKTIKLVDLEDFVDSNVQDLSGGQQQRVALARSLVMEPEMLLLDEPFSALDAFTRAALQKDVRSIAKSLGINLVIVTHNIDEAVLMADRAVIMAGSPGKIRDEIVVSLPEERNAKDSEVQKLREHLMETFRAASSIEEGGTDEAL